MELTQLLSKAVEQETSDIFIIAGLPVTYKINGRIVCQNDEKLMPEDTDRLIREMYQLSANPHLEKLLEEGDDDFSFSLKGLSRFRVNAYKQRGSLAAVIRIITFDLPDYRKLNITDTVMSISQKNSGLVLITGPAASGKSTTLACIINAINETKNYHIITIEDPIEYLHRHIKSIVSQRELQMDTANYVVALRAALRESPDVILLGEMRDYETIRTAMTAAETGHLVISTLHTVGAANTIDRIIDAFPENQQQQIRVQLSMVLEAVVSQHLVPSADGKVVPAYEVMFVNNAIKNMIRESKIHQIDTVISSSADEKMISMDTSLYQLCKSGKITKGTALNYSVNKKIMEKKLELL